MITNQEIDFGIRLFCSKATLIAYENLNKLEKYIYKLYKAVNFKIPRAEKYEYFYIIDKNFEINSFKDWYDVAENKQYDTFNYFLTRTEAEKYAKKLQEYLIELRKGECCNE